MIKDILNDIESIRQRHKELKKYYNNINKKELLEKLKTIQSNFLIANFDFNNGNKILSDLIEEIENSNV